MAVISKSLGTTASERFLARLAERSFLSLWAYPNVYRDRGKELCDLLVVCGNKVIVFSDKSIAWPDGASLDVAWPRWYRRAIGHSAGQLKRAVNWLQAHPDRIYLDAACTQRFPIEIPSADQLEIHAVIVARGASVACRQYFGSGSGSLAISPLDSSPGSNREVPPHPFFIGNPSRLPDTFFHVLDDVTLSILLLELDTITDLTGYLSKKARLVEGNHLIGAHGEEDLLALYLKDINNQGEHDFVVSSGIPLGPNDKIVVEGGSYDAFRRRGEYRRKKAADKVSYFWDRLIEQFAKHILADSSYVVHGFETFHEPTKRELGLRYMALQSRLERRSNSLAIKGAFEKIGVRDRFFRAMLPGPTSPDQDTAFFVLLVKRDSALKDATDDEYRAYRGSVLHAYAMNLLRYKRDLKRVIGIATEGELKTRLRSEDMIYAEQPAWTTEYEKQIEDAAAAAGIFKKGAPSDRYSFHINPKEYPPSHYPAERRDANPIPYSYRPEFPGSAGNRKQRRASRSRFRKGRARPS